MAAMLRDSVVAVVRTRPRAIPLAMITMRKSTHGFSFLSHDEYEAPLGGPSGRRSSANNSQNMAELYRAEGNWGKLACAAGGISRASAFVLLEKS